MFTNQGRRVTLATFEHHKFKQLPDFLDSDQYVGLPSIAKVVFAHLKKRHGLSRKNHWVNESGEVYCNYARKDMAAITGVSENTAAKAIRILKAAGLVEEDRPGLGKENRIYLIEIDESALTYETRDGNCKKGRKRCALGNAQGMLPAAPNFESQEPQNFGPADSEFESQEPQNFGPADSEFESQEPQLFGPAAPAESPASPENPALGTPGLPSESIDLSGIDLSETEVGENFFPSRILESSQVESSQVESSQAAPSQAAPRPTMLSFRIADGYADPQGNGGPDGLDGQDPSEKMAAPHPQNQNPQAQQAARPPYQHPQPEARGESRAELWDKYDRIIKDNINYSALRADRTIDIERVDEAVACMLDVIVSDEKTVWVCQSGKSRETVKSMYLKIREHHIRRVLEKFKAQDQKITKVGAYLKAMIYNEMLENANSYTNEVQADYADMAL